MNQPCHFNRRQKFLPEVGVLPDVLLQLPDLTLQGIVLVSLDDQATVLAFQLQDLKMELRYLVS